MEFSEVLSYALYIVLTIIFPVVSKYVVDLVKAKIAESNMVADAVKNEDMANIVNNALSDVMDAVLYVNQIYTDSLKASGKFDKAAQEEAFHRAYLEAMNIISDESRKAIEELYGSFDKWLQLKIESSVNIAKKQ